MFPLRFVGVTEPVLHAVAAIVGPERIMLGLDAIAWYGILVTMGVVIDEGRRWLRRRKTRKATKLRPAFTPSASSVPF